MRSNGPLPTSMNTRSSRSSSTWCGLERRSSALASGSLMCFLHSLMLDWLSVSLGYVTRTRHMFFLTPPSSCFADWVLHWRVCYWLKDRHPFHCWCIQGHFRRAPPDVGQVWGAHEGAQNPAQAPSALARQRTVCLQIYIIDHELIYIVVYMRRLILWQRPPFAISRTTCLMPPSVSSLTVMATLVIQRLLMIEKNGWQLELYA